ncbi:AAA family ATPase [Gloeobacter morelensis]|uniref:AAA family ATPase n=1 Tax=Gloeobacter morelensis MG652769 TaxID=2781736 RepID=A0ABY3PPA2_9CYAN|nr:AAA family ATPase [Gloeobacter morelensis]UFP95525.1 AAA family ATPase [Gloeobacter morelensis MG652769]
MKIESIRIKNYKVFKDVEIPSLPNLAVFLGANGVGKSTFFDVFSFLKDALINNVRQALTRRGGFKEVVSRGENGPIVIEIKFRIKDDAPLVTYLLHIGLSDTNQPVVKRELLQYRRGQKGKPWRFLDFRNGEGEAIINEADYGGKEDEQKREYQKLASADILAIKGLGQFERFKAVAEFRKLIENWHISDFHISDAREVQDAGYAEHLSMRGENLPLVAQFMYEYHRVEFDKILSRMSQRVPGISKVEATETEDGRIVLKFQDGAFKDPFIARFVSDGTIKMFAYLLLLYDPSPHPLLAVEEPENQLYPELLVELAEEFRQYASKGGQVFISTHSPDFVNGVKLEELFWLTKQSGFTKITRASDDLNLKALVREGDLPGLLWKQGLFEGAGPR